MSLVLPAYIFAWRIEDRIMVRFARWIALYASLCVE